MSEAPSQPTTTPARRRPGRGNGRPAAHKAYASENDAINVDPSRYDRTPRTPQKYAVDSSAPHTNTVNSKQRSRNKVRAPKNMPTSPESGPPGRHTPPQQSSSMKASSIAAFAGATFHASPAPSALPLPSFITKPSMDSPTVKPSREILQEPSPPTDSEAPTPSHQASAPPVQESPLDFMFRAHRQEQERQRRDSPASFRPSAVSSDSPSSRSLFESGNFPKGPILPQSTQPQSRLQSGIGSAELDGTPGRALGPAFSTPYQERIKAARSGTARSPAAQQLPRQSSAPEPGQDPTEALKKFLFSGPSASFSNSAPNGFSPVRPPHAQENHAPTMPNGNGNHEGRPNNLQAMEDDLRRILKLDLAAGPTNAQRRLFS
ncbi:hypothetical protein EDB81DRAFT_56602 [Dactylonectria macrodidyma]|uniref:Proteophosphoglycan 5 n=1 Tax=Dactylonectria macrodidyma TaxID=307937 RepID=A0A9P9ENU6_9HYPO|nr:hypothetical protein EDB81DRAFT_56602 [Dactylonectria macrodidyma]